MKDTGLPPELILLEVREIASFLKIEINDILSFLEIKKYAMFNKKENRWYATAMGVELGYTKNELWPKEGDYVIHFYITKKGYDKIEKAFCNNGFTPEQQKKINALCAAAEKNMKPNCLGLAE